MGDPQATAQTKESPAKVIGMAVIVAFVCALVVSTASVLLKPIQDAHLEAEREARMAAMLDTLPGMRELLEEAGAENLETRLVDLSSGEFVASDDPAAYDEMEAAGDPDAAVPVPSELDVAGLGQRGPNAAVHILEGNGRVQLVVLPVRGTGYQSMIRALLALEADLRTVAALTILEQGETPGLGARIEDPEWQALWPGKEVANEAGEIVISVVKGEATKPYEVDGITGATQTGSGVANMLRYWLGPHGYGPFLERLRSGGL